jgi:flagellar biosynthetic protein FliQ
MNSQTVVDLLRQTMMTAFWVGLPLLAIGFVAGALISIVQIVTSMQDSAFATAPRLAAFLAGAVLLMPWMLAKLITYTTALLGDFSRYAR